MGEGVVQQKRFRNRLRELFLRYALFLVILPLLALFLLVLVALSFSQRQQLGSAMQAISADITGLYDAHYDYIHQKEHQPAFIDLLSGTGDETIFYRDAYAFVNGRAEGSVFIVLNAERQLLCDNMKAADEEIFSFVMRRIFPGILDSNPDRVFTHTIYNRNFDSAVNVVGKAIQADGQTRGYLFFILNNTWLHNTLNRHRLDASIVVDRFDNVVVSASAEQVTNYMGKLNFTPDARAYITLEQELGHGMRAIACLSHSQNRMLVNIGIVVLALLSAALVLMLLFFSKGISRRLTREIDSLVDSVDQLGKGRLDYVVPGGTYYEFSVVAAQLNRMTASLRALDEANAELALLTRNAEVRRLEMQFNPHFIYNALETVQVMAYMDPDKAAEIIRHMSRFLRFSANALVEQATLREDFGYIREYLEVQKARFGEALGYTFEVEAGLEDCLVPKLIIHPLVENSIKHGLAGQKNLWVYITAARVGGDVQLCVRDNGVPMDAGTRRAVQRTLDSPAPPENHIGIYNINRRLKLMYGEGYGITLGPQDGPNRFTVTIPCRFGKTEQEGSHVPGVDR